MSTNRALEAWLIRRGISEREACRRLGLSRPAMARYRRGTRVPRYILLACRAEEEGLEPIAEPKQKKAA